MLSSPSQSAADTLPAPIFAARVLTKVYRSGEVEVRARRRRAPLLTKGRAGLSIADCRLLISDHRQTSTGTVLSVSTRKA